VVTFAILWTLSRLLEPYGLNIVGQLCAAAFVALLVVRPAWQLVRFLSRRERSQPVNKSRVCVTLAGATAIVVALLWLPLPHYVVCAVYLQARGATSVYVDVPGSVREILTPPFDSVTAGQPLVRLENIDLELAVARLDAEREQAAIHLESLRERSLVDDQAAELMAAAEESLAAFEEQLARKEADLRRLIIRAPASGVLAPAALRPAEQAERGVLANWSGHPLELRNVGAFLASGVVVGEIGDPSALEAVLTIDEASLDFVRVGQAVDVVLDELPGERLTTTLATLSAEQLDFAPAALSHKSGGELVTRTDARGRERPVATTYQAGAPIVNADGRLVAGARGKARIFAGYETLGTRLLREARRVLVWEM
jgi:putative peptide zinc metalloprotease protein